MHPRHHVGPAWPPDVTAYDYVLTLCWSDLAWEFLRRNPAYQRDYRLNRKGRMPPRLLKSGVPLICIRRHTPRAHQWDLSTFVDPTLQASEAPVHWSATAAAPILQTITDRLPNVVSANPFLVTASAARHIVIGPAGHEAVLLRDSTRALTLDVRGSRISIGPVVATFLIDELPDPRRTAATFQALIDLTRRPRSTVHTSRERFFLRDALISLDGRCFGASYRETADVIFGAKRVAAAWSSPSTSLKEHMRRARTKGEQLRNGGYRKLLDRWCRFKR